VIYAFALVYIGFCGIIFNFLKILWDEGERFLVTSIAAVLLGISSIVFINLYNAQPF
jgi:hypothetical protein